MNKESKYAAVAKSLWINNAFISKKIENSLGSIHGIGLTEYMVLHNLVNAPNKVLRRIDLADSVGRTASGVTRMLIPMEKLGLICKEASPRDARASLVKITTVGEEIFNDASLTLNQTSEQLLDRLDKEQIDTFFNLLNLIRGV
ncbi:MAG: MarR family transcriptional regulator [Alteromonadaceae bacterium]|nr:MarR family transcriptional regulator [Alteromonadaceae bacterium]